jgi:phage terminase large subunit GpA-like protein
MPCTVIRPDDMADQILNQAKFPAWQGERTKAIYSWPTNEKLWNDYGELWRAGFIDGGDKGVAAVAFYKANRKEMDKGAEVAWEARKYEDDISAIQHLMNHRFTIGDEAFMAEFQNEPLKGDETDVPMLSVDDIAKKLNALKRYAVPAKTDYVTAQIDVHDDLLYYVVAAWTGEFTGAVIDYGTYPDQRLARFSKASAKRTMQKAAPGAGRLGAIRKGLDILSAEILEREYLREDGAVMRVERCLVDAGHEPDVVYDFCRSSPHAAILMPSLGAGIGAKNKPMLEYARKRGDKMGSNWYIPAPIRGRSGRYVRLDTNHWKRFVHDRLAVAIGDDGCLTLWGNRPAEHIMFAEHLTAESPTMVTANGRTVGEWSMRPGRSDNHLFDGMVGCAVAASMSGAVLSGARGATQAQKRKRYR